MRKITVFDDTDFELLALENDFDIDAKKEWKAFLDKANIPMDSLLDYDQLNDLILHFLGYDMENIDKAFAMIVNWGTLETSVSKVQPMKKARFVRL